MRVVLPLSTLIGIIVTSAIAWIVVNIDPSNTTLLVFPVFVILVFLATTIDFGLLLYLIRTKLYGKQIIDRKWYFTTSLKMSFFVALFLALVTTLAILKLVNIFNIGAVILVITLFALWVYLGKR